MVFDLATIREELIGSVNTSATLAIYPRGCYSTINFLERASGQRRRPAAQIRARLRPRGRSDRTPV
jgi:hypothetical protein